MRIKIKEIKKKNIKPKSKTFAFSNLPKYIAILHAFPMYFKSRFDRISNLISNKGDRIMNYNLPYV